MKVIFICSRDFQVRNYLSLVKSFEEENVKMEPIFLSISKWSHGGASRVLSHNNSFFYEMPRIFSERKPYFFKKTAFIELLLSVPILVYFLAKVFKKHRPDAIIVEQKKGFFEFILSAFAQKYQISLILYQHGYEMFHNSKRDRISTMFRSWVLRVLSYNFTTVLISGLNSSSSRKIKYDLCLIYSQYAERIARQQLDCKEYYICGNLSIRSMAGLKNSGKESTDGVLICSNGFLRYSNLKLRSKTLELISSLYHSFRECAPVKIRLKPGEFVDRDEFSKYSLSSQVFADNTVAMSSQLQEYKYVICSDISTVGLECFVFNKKLLTYSVGESPYNFFSSLYQKMDVNTIGSVADHGRCNERFDHFSDVNASDFEFYTGILKPGGNANVVNKIYKAIQQKKDTYE
jgi:hypothetical protein